MEHNPSEVNCPSVTQ